MSGKVTNEENSLLGISMEFLVTMKNVINEKKYSRMEISRGTVAMGKGKM